MANRSRLSRDTDQALVAGVCAGIARRLGIDPALVRVGAVVLTIATGGIAALVYGLLWVILPADGTEQPTGGSGSRTESRAGREGEADTATEGRASWIVGVGAGLITLGLLFVFRELGIWWSDSLVWPLVLATAGVALFWRQFTGPGADQRDDPDRDGGPRVAGRPAGRDDPGSPGPGPGGTETASRAPKSRLGPYRGGFGVALILGGALLFLYINGALGGAGNVALAVVTAFIVLGLVLAPLWVRLARNLSAERAARIRSQERAELAAHLHDSVLQTLALIQKRPEDSRRISTLARRQERELREWLSGDPDRDRADSLSAAIESVAAEVEERHEVPVEVVTVGDCDLDRRNTALVAASREALTNAARHAGEAGPVRIYAEIDPSGSQVFVHDRGDGFDLGAVPPDRRGVRDSIVGRMERHGGSARVRSTPGEGTEIELIMEAK
ncbi:MAG: PspC domain-containing protein [Acidobacteriota bacterium]